MKSLLTLFSAILLVGLAVFASPSVEAKLLTEETSGLILEPIIESAPALSITDIVLLAQVDTVADPGEVIESWTDIILEYLAGILLILEVVMRFIPTKTDPTILGNIFRVLLAISDFLNKRK